MQGTGANQAGTASRQKDTIYSQHPTWTRGMGTVHGHSANRRARAPFTPEAAKLSSSMPSSMPTKQARRTNDGKGHAHGLGDGAAPALSPGG